MRFKIDWASLIVGSKFTVFALFYFVFEGNFPSTSPRGAYIWRGDLTEGFFRYRFGGLIHGGAYFRNFTVYYLFTSEVPGSSSCTHVRFRANEEIPLGNANIIITRLLSGATFKFTILWKLFIWRRQTRTYSSQ